VLNEESQAENIIFYVQPKSDSKNDIPQKLYAHVKRLPWISKGKTVAVISIYDLSKTLKIEKMQSDFVANASHELRTPLSVISGFIETLQTSAKDDEKARDEFLKIMGEQAKYMTLLIENLLSLSRIELNQDKMPEDEIIIAPIVEDTIEAMKTKASGRNITFETNISNNLPPVVADYAQIRQLLQNLCDNAVKYGEVGGKITITAEKCNEIPSSKSYQVAEGEAVSVAVNNRGTVISPDEIERLTERFYRMKTHKEKNINGTGLGLAIVKHILIRHRGNLKIESSEEDGTTFTFYLPVDRTNN
jgi:two-component system phosphate regulon sensor histidine kinase PhoR